MVHRQLWNQHNWVDWPVSARTQIVLPLVNGRPRAIAQARGLLREVMDNHRGLLAVGLYDPRNHNGDLRSIVNSCDQPHFGSCCTPLFGASAT